jgi:energy-coupling factor transport system ATP-binding protein
MIENIHEHEKNITILVTHKMDDVARLADKVMVMESGKLVMNGTPTEIFSRKEELQAMGLSIPEATELIGDLRDCGMNLATNVLTLEQAEETLVSYLKPDQQ